MAFMIKHKNMKISKELDLTLNYGQAQPLAHLEAELALIPIHLATHQPLHPPTWTSMKKVEINSDQKQMLLSSMSKPQKILNLNLIDNNLFQCRLHTAWIITNNLLYKIDHHSKNHTSSLDQKSVMAKKNPRSGAVCVAPPLLASHSRSLRHHCSTPFLFIRSNYNLAVPIPVRRGSTILFMTAGLSVQLTVRAPSPSL